MSTMKRARHLQPLKPPPRRASSSTASSASRTPDITTCRPVHRRDRTSSPATERPLHFQPAPQTPQPSSSAMPASIAPALFPRGLPIQTSTPPSRRVSPTGPITTLARSHDRHNPPTPSPRTTPAEHSRRSIISPSARSYNTAINDSPSSAEHRVASLQNRRNVVRLMQLRPIPRTATLTREQRPIFGARWQILRKPIAGCSAARRRLFRRSATDSPTTATR
jgi:hypothetical protein